MTAPAIAAPNCPKCSGPMWDQKNGKFPWKQGTPIFKCRDKECASAGGVIWEPKTTPPKPSVPKTQLPQARSYGTPEFLPTEGEEQAELQKKIGFDIGVIQKELALYQSLTEWVNTTIAPIYQKSGVGMSPESAVAATATLFINTAGKK